MRFFAPVAATVALSSVVLAQSSSWDSWVSQPTVPVTTTITKTLLHYNETVTSTSYSATGTGSRLAANVTTTSTYKPATLTPSGTTAAIATFSSGAASVQEVNVAIAALAGVGAFACAFI